MEKKVFPSNFLWGTATSAHQVEGDTFNDWTEWERRGGSKNLSGKACDHWNLNQFEEDVERMKALGLNAYRMGIEWSRVMPGPGVIKQGVLDQYRQMLIILREAGISTMVTLHHFTNPIWFVKSGGWTKASLKPFYDYVDATKVLADNVDYWNTFNEPLILVYNGYLSGQWPPGKKGKIVSAWHLRKRFAEAHNEVYRIVKENTGRPVGLVHNFTSYETAHNNRLIERAVAGLQDRIFNRWIIEHTENDFLGVNFYFRQVFDGFRPLPASKLGKKVSDFGWEIIPESLTRVLLGLKKYNLPIYVTENGVADAKDTLRADFIRDNIQALRLAMRAGVDVKGYFYWSLLDNFEWAEGYTKRFGLIEVNFENQERRIRPSAYTYRDISKIPD